MYFLGEKNIYIFFLMKRNYRVEYLHMQLTSKPNFTLRKKVKRFTNREHFIHFNQITQRNIYEFTTMHHIKLNSNQSVRDYSLLNSTKLVQKEKLIQIYLLMCPIYSFCTPFLLAFLCRICSLNHLMP